MIVITKNNEQIEVEDNMMFTSIPPQYVRKDGQGGVLVSDVKETIKDGIHKVNKGDYVSVFSDSGKLRVKGSSRVYSEATEFKDKPREYEEVLENDSEN